MFLQRLLSSLGEGKTMACNVSKTWTSETSGTSWPDVPSSMSDVVSLSLSTLTFLKPTFGHLERSFVAKTVYCHTSTVQSSSIAVAYPFCATDTRETYIKINGGSNIYLGFRTSIANFSYNTFCYIFNTGDKLLLTTYQTSPVKFLIAALL